ncbi:MAG: Flp pilus assembly protein CpaB [Anaerolineae bacterium]|nr:Flp pilus assembly protein CpaB [Anaerolineae bacterium]
MKRRGGVWFVAAVLLAVLAGVIAIFALRQAASREASSLPASGRTVVVARQPIAVSSSIGVEDLLAEERSDSPDGAATSIQDVLGRVALRNIAQGEVITMQELASAGLAWGTSEITGTRSLAYLLGNDKIAVALPATDILSKWGAVAAGDHVDVLFTLDVLLETPFPAEMPTGEEATLFERLERDQSLDSVSVLTVQNLKVLQVIEDPAPEVQSQQQQQQQQLPSEPRRALILKIDPQDAAVLKYLLDSTGKIDLALRSPTNNTLFDVEPVNINYLVLRYGIRLPEPLE